MPAVDISPVPHYAPRRHVYLYMSVCLSLSHGQYDHDIITQRDRHVHTHTHTSLPAIDISAVRVGRPGGRSQPAPVHILVRVHRHPTLHGYMYMHGVTHGHNTPEYVSACIVRTARTDAFAFVCAFWHPVNTDMPRANIQSR